MYGAAFVSMFAKKVLFTVAGRDVRTFIWIHFGNYSGNSDKNKEPDTKMIYGSKNDFVGIRMEILHNQKV